MNNQNTIFDQKKQLRNTLKQKRAEISADDRAIYSKTITERLLQLEEIKQANSIFTYISYANEVETHDLLKELLKEGKKIVVPKIISAELMVAQNFESWDDLVPGSLGILTPQNTHITKQAIDVAITPGLGFTEQGHRIGFGAGYYDRWFASHEVHLKIAICFEAQIVESLPIENTDIPVDAIMTEKRLLRI